ncbi:hypothetical protein CNMCM5793_000443 [Aspergillus hiratsukae]|uniref:Uncharacterized protein n=1 Tax=Aspergillus hiratsukae TaxID=1194566 RepID=A0A8H6PA78_9EURO|nr:hypothetical protein CNMCM5793_000443 [Aspergillus hiratsukae]KAF7161985.1 hypothetical protein CNMCM6106_009066 [Aspergillus hiratsukae]
MLTRLPEEIVCAIVAQLSPATLVMLSCVSKRFHAICLPLLYKRVVIDGCTIAKWRRMVNSAGLLDQALDGQDSSVLHELQSLQHLETILLYHAQNPRFNFTWRLPQFKNLQSLALHRLGERAWTDRNSDVVEVQLASPGLRHLGLSLKLDWTTASGLTNDFLCMVITEFRSRRQQLEQPALKLESLHLGIGTMPCSNPRFEPTADYLDGLTDLSHLTSLRLDNMHYFSSELEGPVVPYESIDPTLFKRAINLKRISVERFGPDILRLVQLLQDVQAPLKLDALDVLEYGNTLQPDSPPEPTGEFRTAEYVGEPIYSVPLHETGHAWRRLCYSGPLVWDDSKERLKKSRELLTHFVARCTALEELIVPIHNRDELDILKSDVLPCLPNLHTLHLSWPHLAAFLSDLETPWHEPYHLHHMSEEEKERLFQEDRELDREQEKSRISLVHELFSYHIQLREDRAEMSPLRYIAINRDVYTRYWTDAPDEGLYRLNDGSSIVRLSRDEARTVIKALYDYQPEPGNTQELAFSKGDFFHVISREDDSDWYEACNPLIPSARGLVPVSFFEVIGKNERDSGGSVDLHKKKESHDSGFSDRGPAQFPSPDHTPTQLHHPSAAPRMSTLGKPSSAMVYGIVQYDFQAERPDELDAKAGEAIIVIAQSNPEWFVAKPIGRLGGPGLIPVSFIELRDMQTGQAVTDPLEAVKRAGVPRVEEWKKMTAEYKNSSITLGKIDSAASTMQSVTSGVEKMSMGRNSAGHTGQNGNAYGYHNRNASKASLPQHLSQPPMQNHHQPLVAPVAASIPRYCFDNDKYWYIIEAKMEDGRCWELSRYYHDFYDFQIALLTQFEEEAGNRGKPRTLPFMPGPVTHVTDAISNGRRQNLDEYIKKLLSMPPHISRCQLVRQLFAPRPGDFEIDPSAFGEDARYSGGSHHSSTQEASRSASRQSSQAQMSSHSDRTSHQRSQPSVSLPADRPGPMNRQASSLTQVSTASSGGAMKVKVFFQDDLIAIRVPSDISFQQLREKLLDRLKVNEEIVVTYKDEPSGTYMDLNNDSDLDTAIQRNSKLTLYVGLA